MFHDCITSFHGGKKFYQCQQSYSSVDRLHWKFECSWNQTILQLSIHQLQIYERSKSADMNGLINPHFYFWLKWKNMVSGQIISKPDFFLQNRSSPGLQGKPPLLVVWITKDLSVPQDDWFILTRQRNVVVVQFWFPFHSLWLFYCLRFTRNTAYTYAVIPILL